MDLLAFNLPIVVLLPFLGAVLAAYSARFTRLAAAYTSAGITVLSLAFLARDIFAFQ